MSDLRSLYQEIIIDHGRNPRNFRACEHATHIKEGHNPLCGDQVTVYVCKRDQKIEEITFQGKGCAISMASSSLMTEILKGKDIIEVEELFSHFHEMVTKGVQDNSTEKLGKLSVLSGVNEFPARVKCATLAWHALLAALQGSENKVTTE